MARPRPTWPKTSRAERRRFRPDPGTVGGQPEDVLQRLPRPERRIRISERRGQRGPGPQPYDRHPWWRFRPERRGPGRDIGHRKIGQDCFLVAHVVEEGKIVYTWGKPVEEMGLDNALAQLGIEPP